MARQQPDPLLLKRGFERIGEAMAALIEASLAAGGRVKGYPLGIVALVSYLIAHEAHHRGGILLTLKQSGFRLNDRLRWGLWDWNRFAREMTGARA